MQPTRRRNVARLLFAASLATTFLMGSADRPADPVGPYPLLPTSETLNFRPALVELTLISHDNPAGGFTECAMLGSASARRCPHRLCELNHRLPHSVLPRGGSREKCRLKARGLDQTRPVREVCARARDAEQDALQVRWEAFSIAGDRVDLPQPHYRKRTDAGLVECIHVLARGEPLEVWATASDGRGRDLGAPKARSRRTLYLSARDEVGGAQDLASNIDVKRVWIRRDGRLLAAFEDLSGVRSGDVVQVEFEVRQGCGRVRAGLVAHRRQGEDVSDVGLFEAGTQVLEVEVPRAAAVLNLVVWSVGRMVVVDQATASLYPQPTSRHSRPNPR